jgi:hypothetical protein
MKNKRYALAVLLVFASSVVFAQYPQPQTLPPDITPKSFPPDIVAPSSELSSQNAPRPLAPEAVKRAIESDLHRHTEIVSANINVNVTKHAVVLYGSVPSAHDDAVAKGIAESHAGKRRVEDNLQIGPPR